MDKNFWKKVLDTIEKEKILPISKKIFVLQNLGVWSGIILSLLVGVIILSIFYSFWEGVDWDMWRYIGMWKMMVSLYHPWLFLLIIVCLLWWIFFFSRTERGYKISSKNMFLSIVLLVFFSSLLFFHFFFWGVNMYAERHFGWYSTYMHQNTQQEMYTIWQNPEKGLLIWEIVWTQEKSITLKDSTGKEWEILYDQTTTVKGKLSLTSGETIKIIGKQISDSQFQASEFRPLMGKWRWYNFQK